MAVPTKTTPKADMNTWYNTEVFVVYDPKYTQQEPSQICTACKVTRSYDTIHSELYPHAPKCRNEKTGFFSGYVIGPNVRSEERRVG